MWSFCHFPFVPRSTSTLHNYTPHRSTFTQHAWCQLRQRLCQQHPGTSISVYPDGRVNYHCRGIGFCQESHSCQFHPPPPFHATLSACLTLLMIHITPSFFSSPEALNCSDGENHHWKCYLDADGVHPKEIASQTQVWTLSPQTQYHCSLKTATNPNRWLNYQKL